MRIYFMGICGTGMGNTALLMRALGHDVCGADAGVYPPMSDVLARAGITVHEGYDVRRLRRLHPDLVVVGNAVSRGHPEVEFLLNEQSLLYTSLPALLHDYVLTRERHNIVVAGTHGKTTTAVLTAFLLRENGLDPGWLAGGVPRDLPAGAHLGGLASGNPFVIEGDEYDSAFFDKRGKFIHYRPRMLLVNNLEFDHGDIFRDLEDVRRSFSHLLRIVPGNGCVIINGDDPNVAALLPVPWTAVWRAGTGEGNDLRISGFEEDENGSRFDLAWQGRPWARAAWKLHGLYNARNAAMAALAAGLCRHPGNPAALTLDALARFQGVKRRQEILYEDERLTVLEDFAHHPTALAAALESFRRRYPGRRLLACFEPRSNTARTKVFQDAFTDALSGAGSVFIGPVHRAEKLEEPNRLDTEEIAAGLRRAQVDAEAFATHEDLLSSLIRVIGKNRRERLAICFFSNGAFGGIMPRFVACLRERAEKVSWGRC